MGICIDKLPHSCGTKKGLQVFVDERTNKINGFCFSCQTLVLDPYGDGRDFEEKLIKSKSPKEIERELNEIESYQTVSIPTRMLRKDMLLKSGVKVSLSEEDGKTPTAMFFPISKKKKVSGYYVKTLGKNKYTWSIGDVKGGEPFGWKEAYESGSYELIITEGLEDKIALDQILEKHGEQRKSRAVISLPNGVNSVNKSLGPLVNDLKNFKSVIICFDNDEPGNKAVKDAVMLLPQAKIVSLPCKDANDCILKGKTLEAYKAVAFQAKPPKNTRLVLGRDIMESAREPTPYGELSWPFQTMDKLLRGIRYGETIYIGSGVKMG